MLACLLLQCAWRRRSIARQASLIRQRAQLQRALGEVEAELAKLPQSRLGAPGGAEGGGSAEGGSGGAEGGGAEGGGAEGGGEGGGGAEGEQVQRKSVRCRGNAEFMEIRAKFEWGVHAISRQLSFDNRRRRRLRSLRSREVGDGSPSHGAAPTPVASSPLGDYCPLRAPPNTPCNAPGQEQPAAAREPCSVPRERGESAGSGSGSAGGAAARRRWGMDDVLDAQKRWLKVQQRLMQSPVSPFSP